MGNERVFSAVNTKIRVLKSRLLNDKDYENLIERDTLEEQIEYLNTNTIYGEVLKEKESIHTIEEVELFLKEYLINQYEKIINFLNGEYRGFLKALLLRYEIEYLKIYIRALERKEDTSNLYKYGIPNQKYYSFDAARIVNSSTLEELINNLRNTIYYDVLFPYKDEKDQKAIFYMEMNLDRLYFNNLKSKLNNLGKEDKLLFEEILGINEDLLNIEWLYRGIKFYRLLPEELINFTLSHGLIFKYRDLKILAYGDEEGLKKKVLSTRYEFLFNSEKDIDLYMNRRIERYLYYQLVKIFKDGKMNIMPSVAYIHLLSYEIEDITAILEAKRYGLNKEESKEYLVRKIEGSDR